MCLFDYPPIELSAGSACKHQKRTQDSQVEIIHPSTNLCLQPQKVKKGVKKMMLFIESALDVMNNVALQWYIGALHANPLIGFNNLTVL